MVVVVSVLDEVLTTLSCFLAAEGTTAQSRPPTYLFVTCSTMTASGSSVTSILTLLPPLSAEETPEILQTAAKLIGSSEEADKAAWERKTCNSSNASASGPLAEALSSESHKYLEHNYGNDRIDAGKSVGESDNNDDDTPGTTFRHQVLEDESNPNDLKLFMYVRYWQPQKGQVGNWSCECSWNAKKDLFSGTISLHVHSLEGGDTVHLRATKHLNETSFAPMDAKGMIDLIAQGLVQIQKDLSTADATTALKDIRRILPVTRKRMNWNMAAQQAVQTLNRSVGGTIPLSQTIG